ncbi:MAG TPA: formate dehydrogenase subunit gamma [Usitatibacter sp.]|nr:formate dehydrogenase subunit gamma [Usitatibacter sp.]
MLKAHARLWGALILGSLLALPVAVNAQAPASPAPPTTAPTSKANADKMPSAPQATSAAPTPSKGSTAVPGWNNPPAWDTASERPQYASVPGIDTNRLIQGAGREWREFRNGPLTRFGGWFLVGVLAIIILLYLWKGTIRLHGAPTGRLIERFNAVERISHWVVAISFVFLAISGIVILWGKHIILPWLGYTGFSWLTILSKNIHNFVGPLFIFALVVMFLIYVKDNFFASGDGRWLAHGGGMLSGNELPSGRFNAGEKLWFWIGVVLLGTVLSVTGLILDFPNWNQGRELMQQANVIHAVAAAFFIALGLGHAYMGTLMVDGAWRAMRDGYVDETWAREHHSLWYDEVKAGRRPERIVAGRAQPVAGDD